MSRFPAGLLPWPFPLGAEPWQESGAGSSPTVILVSVGVLQAGNEENHNNVL